MSIVTDYFNELESLRIQVIENDKGLPVYDAAEYSSENGYFERLCAMENKIIRKLKGKEEKRIEAYLHSLNERRSKLELAEEECRELTKKWETGEFVDIDFELNVLGKGGFSSPMPKYANYSDEFLNDILFGIMYKGASIRGVIAKMEDYSEKPHSQEGDREIILKHIKHLKGLNSFKVKIMTDKEFERLFSDLCYLVENDELPSFDAPMRQIGVTNASLIYTFREIHKEIFTTKKIKDSFIEFLEKYFAQLANYESMRVAFSKKKPKLYPF